MDPYKQPSVIDEKEILIARDEEEAAGAPARLAPAGQQRQQQKLSFGWRLLRFSAWTLFALAMINALSTVFLEIDTAAISQRVGGCMGRPHRHHGHHGHHAGHHARPHLKDFKRPFAALDEKHGDHEDNHRHHRIPDVSKWVKYDGTTEFELEPKDVVGLSIDGARSFGKVVFETSKLSDKVKFELDIRTNRNPDEGDISVELKDGLIKVNSPNTGDLETYASAKVQIPSNIIGTFDLPRFQVAAPRHMVDLSGLPESLEIGELSLNLAKGFVKAGKVHTNKTDIKVAKGGVRGPLVNARESTSIDVASGNVVVDLVGIAGGYSGKVDIKLGSGDLNGTFDIFQELNFNVAKGNIWADASFPTLDNKDDDVETPRATFSTKVASGDARVYVDGELKDRTFDATHTAINGKHLLTYPNDFQGTVDVRALVGQIELAGDGLTIEKSLFGRTATKGDGERNKISVKNAKGDVDVLIGEESQ